ncbi:tRNA (adenosine(37)-N6)-threonylcarbamoyltransferase complex dimerization subunit type 1 TsaB [Sedimentibacter sp. MB31-C6]|uniref:tRNA (adenosine(37)-N6)-threonylcarbamoyltransferase complex dimerization subunit type 1 TsaB n=1 Tax=Sedimentibacter sp. MB31-C6 TaxID=3109366 RepID=UPI002DDD73B1|nr:tRNA (adenosine(37)-N6)-threonylcarbamoyltransferase complex dimerization subunit type 1 TsaB [Sedimentibacter sp. MB36-C1]WSI03778.1 tRNA (adenosine(37)-N6)-threonylcarbamoyltransferase complex dimerization subunit type 1 TsaB [Sedimentibacter sp. MB36-C1]
MKVLAIESASVIASCAISEDDTILGEFTLGHKKTHSEKLMPLIEELFDELEMKIQDINMIAISEGPGSYTGLRIGGAIAKSLAYAVDIPIVNIPSMMSLAANIYNTDKLIVPIMDAKAGRIYTGIYKWNNEKLFPVKKQFPCNIDELIEKLNDINEPVLFNGDGSINYRKTIEEKLKIKPIFSPYQYNYLKASTLTMLGYEMAKKGQTINPSQFVPQYLRLSQAERNIKSE